MIYRLLRTLERIFQPTLVDPLCGIFDEGLLGMVAAAA